MKKTKLISHTSKILSHTQKLHFTTTTEPVKLYHFGPSTCSWRIRAALFYKKIPFEVVNIKLSKKEQHQESYEKINPMKQVPALEIDGKILTQTIPIMEYLEETRPAPAILPKDLYLRFKARFIICM